MHKSLTTLLALTFSIASLTTFASAHNGSDRSAPRAYNAAATLVADRDDRDDNDDRYERGNRCVNPAGHVRGRCRNNRRNGYNQNGYNRATIAGTVVGFQGGDIVDFRADNGQYVVVNESALLRAGEPLQQGAHYTLQGYFQNNVFVADANGYGYNGGYPNGGYPNGGYPNGGYPGNGYPQQATVRGVVTSINGTRVTLMNGLFSTVTLDDRQALSNGSAYDLSIGRSITAYGYWSGNVFYAQTIN